MAILPIKEYLLSTIHELLVIKESHGKYLKELQVPSGNIVILKMYFQIMIGTFGQLR